MMDERETDRLLGDLFKRNAPYVNEGAMEERVSVKLPRRKRRSRRMRTARILAVGLATVVLAVGLALGAYQVATYVQGRSALVVTDSTLPSTGSATSDSGGAAASSVLTGLIPVMGTATLEQVKSEGAGVESTYVNYATQVTSQVLVYSLDMSQSGTNGNLEITADLDVRADGSVEIDGSWLLSNDEGAWECASWGGVVTGTGSEQFAFGEAVGSGAYEGLTLYLLWYSPQTTGSAAPAAESGRISGWIRSAE
jgi:hypothetical protein